ncbi:hypothetical protein NMG60_11032135 [Bertholletia excelsa]
MAKKKHDALAKPAQHETEDASEKLENLRSLNSMLLKEAMERRQQVDSLIRSKSSLESALTRSESENHVLQAELTRLHDLDAQMELESCLVSVFVSVQVSQQAQVFEKKLRSLQGEIRDAVNEKREVEKESSKKDSEICLLKEKFSELVLGVDRERSALNRMRGERDALRAEIDVQIAETNELRIKLVEAEKNRRMMGEEIHQQKMKYNSVMKEKEGSEIRIESIMSEKNSIERCLCESNKVIEGLKREIEDILREKKGIEKQRNVEMMKKNELETSVASLNEVVQGLQKEEKKLRKDVEDLEKKCGECVEKEKQMVKETDALMEEKRERERSFDSLIEEKELVKKELDVALKEQEVRKQKMDEIVGKIIEIEGVNVRRESEIVQLQRQVSELQDAISGLEALCRDHQEKSNRLKSEVNQCRCVINQLTTERDAAREGLSQEKRCSSNLMEKILEMEKNLEKTKKVLDETKTQKCTITGEKKELESRCAILTKEIASLENTLVKAREELGDVQAKVKSNDASSELVLNMLRHVAAMAGLSEDEKCPVQDVELVSERLSGEEIKPYMEEFETIKNAFKNRDSKVDNMKRELEFLQNSVAEAHKIKGFWTLVSSAAIVSIAFVAYVARLH